MHYNRNCVGLADTADNQGISYPGRFMEHDHQPIDPPNNGSPIGYCPHCDYQLLAPGRCSECGKEIPTKRIRHRPRAARRIRWLKRGLAISVLVSLALGGRWALQGGYQYRLYSNTLLVDAYPADTMAAKEIARRIGGQGMTDDQLQALIDKSFNVTMSVRSPRPRRIKAGCHIKINTKAGSLFKLDPDFFSIKEYFEAQLDGLAVVPQTSSLSLDNGSNQQTTDAILFFDRNPGTGDHELELRVNARLATVDPTLNGALATFANARLQVPLNARFNVIDQSIFEMLKCLDSEADIAALKENCRMGLVKNGLVGSEFQACARAIKSDSYWYVLVSELQGQHGRITTKTEIYFSPSMMRPSSWITISDAARGMTRAECRWSCDYTAQFDKGADAVYPFALNWTFTDSDNLPEFKPNCPCELPYARPPDQIIRLNNVERAGS